MYKTTFDSGKRSMVGPWAKRIAMLLGGASLTLVSGSVVATLGAEPIDFEQQIRPLLQQRCVECHGVGKQKGELRLDARRYALRGGQSGPVIVAGKSSDSELIRRVTSDDTDERMPPEGRPLSAAEVALLTRWVDAGAHWPETQADRDAGRDTRRDHWAWQPIRAVVLPDMAPDATYRLALGSAVDRLVAVKLADHRLTFSAEADRRVLIRRLSFDLLGLPPTPEQVTQFSDDPDPRAYEKLVDRMLDSPHYGERWARHWLDIAHYADTHGFERDQRRDNAWRYRDWVIRAFNADLPYDQFLRDQIAGDALRPDDPDAVIATGFLAAGPWDFVGQAETPSPVLKRLARADDLDDIVTQVITAACGVTIHCARCHDHKLDPISQREYYALWSVFAGVKRGDRVVSAIEERQLAERRASLERQVRDTRRALSRLKGAGWSLPDIVGGGDGLGTGKANSGIDPATGDRQIAGRGFLEGAAANQFHKSTVRFVDGVVIPNGGDSGEVPISSTGLVAREVPRTSGKAWDAIRNGPVNSHFSTKLGGIDFVTEGHTLLSLHANAAITFDLAELRKEGAPSELRFRGATGYFGQTPRNGASLRVLLDGRVKMQRDLIGRDDGLEEFNMAIPEAARFLTLLATDGGNDIGHDQIGFADARLESAQPNSTAPNAVEIESLTRQCDLWQRELETLPQPAKVYSVLSETPPPVHVLARGNPEQPQAAVSPGALECVAPLRPDFGTTELTDGQRRMALAGWITDPANPLTRRVIVNRLWHYHFGVGLVETPSDFGLGGSLPTHPELLDWLADELLRQRWSLKSIHRLICLSAAYRQSSLAGSAESAAVDASNRWLWRQNPRRLDAESVRDAVLFVSGNLNATMFGPGYRDFEYKEEYAPVYTYVTPDKPELWRRSIYRFVVRTTPHQFLTTLDCPNPANLTPVRSTTTTALQSLALLNNDFMLRQADQFGQRVRTEAGAASADQVTRAFQLALARDPSSSELAAGQSLVVKHGLTALCRFLLNANEFVYVD